MEENVVKFSTLVAVLDDVTKLSERGYRFEVSFRDGRVVVVACPRVIGDKINKDVFFNYHRIDPREWKGRWIIEGDEPGYLEYPADTYPRRP